MLAGIGVLDDRQTLSDRGHHPVLDAVVDHLYEVARAVRTAVEVALLRGAAGLAARRRLGRALARRDRLPDGVEALHGLVVAADHQAVAAVEAPDATRRAAVHEVDALARQFLGVLDVVAVVRVATVDQGVVVLEELLELVDHLLHEAGRHHDPDVARALHLRDQVCHRGGADCALGDEVIDGLRVDVEDDAGVAIAHQATDKVRAHPAEADHSELHGVCCCHGGAPWFYARFMAR